MAYLVLGTKHVSTPYWRSGIQLVKGKSENLKRENYFWTTMSNIQINEAKLSVNQILSAVLLHECTQNVSGLHKWSASNILASMDSFWCLLSKSAGTPATTLGHFFLFRMPDLDLFKIQNLINSDEIIQIGIVLPPVVITNITFTLKFAHDLIRSS